MPFNKEDMLTSACSLFHLSSNRFFYQPAAMRHSFFANRQPLAANRFSAFILLLADY